MNDWVCKCKETRPSLTEEMIQNYDALPPSLYGWRRYRIEYGFECGCPEGTIYLPPDADPDIIEEQLNIHRKPKTKHKLFLENNYKYLYQNMVYVSKVRKQVFSKDFVEANSFSYLENLIKEHNKDWKLHFVQVLSKAAQKEVLEEINGNKSK